MKFVMLFIFMFVLGLILSLVNKKKIVKNNGGSLHQSVTVPPVKKVVENEALHSFLATYLDYTNELTYEFLENYSQVIAFRKDNRKLSMEVLDKMRTDENVDLIALKSPVSITITSFQSPNKMVAVVEYEKAIHEMYITVLSNNFFIDGYEIRKK